MLIESSVTGANRGCEPGTSSSFPEKVLSGQRTLVLVEGPQGAASGDNMEIKTLFQIIIEEEKEN